MPIISLSLQFILPCFFLALFPFELGIRLNANENKIKLSILN